jgi:topoisomerase IA-like protein
MNFTFTWILDKFGFQPKVEVAPAKKVAVKKPAAKKAPAKKTTAKKTAKKKVS